MKLPRDITADELTQRLKRYGYQITRQTGSHVRLTTTKEGEHHVSIPRHKSLRVGIISSVLTEIATHLKTDRETLIKELFSR